jgi:acyl-CoA reductase-like NAD-dependent aldehyde dehydrogenase
LDALIGEVLVTCEKLSWLISSGEQHLQKEYRDTGKMMMMKKVYVEFVPLGVIGAIVPWNCKFFFAVCLFHLWCTFAYGKFCLFLVSQIL